MPKPVTIRAQLLYLPFELVFGVLIPLAIVNGIDAADFWYALRWFLILGLGRALITILYGFPRVLRPIDRWLEEAPSRPEARELQEIDERIRRAPIKLAVWTFTAWVVQIILALAYLMYVDPYRAAIPPRAVLSAALMCSGLILVSIPLLVPMMSVQLNDSARRLFGISHGASLPLRRMRASLRFKLVYLMAAIGMAGPLWIASTTTSVETARAMLEARAQSKEAALKLAGQIGSVDPADTTTLNRLVRDANTHGIAASISNREGAVIAGERRMADHLSELLMPKGGEPKEFEASPRDSQVAARTVSANGLTVVVVSQLGDWTSSSLVLMLAVFLLVLLLWTPVCAYYLSVDVTRPIVDITRALQQITEVGKLDEVATVPVTQNDETGALAMKFNDLVETLRDLSAAARALATGDLEIRLSGEGDVATAFRAMIESLSRIVRQIHETSVLLAAATTQIYAASQEQEAAAASQSTAMTEIRQTMESLFEAAAHVAESVRGVLSNAERTLETTDRMVVRIGDLTNHAGRIGEILETIRDISDRSDLLALNGALEASRAGEAGRGFGLVAAEMRRLAERVMSSVHDVRALVGDIRASGSSTMMATEDSKKLAASTTDAARQITMVTQQQRSGTEQVLQSVREIAETLTQSVAAMGQSRASAEQLKVQADKLSTLVRAFRIETTQT
jgi:methyl-accepting chemotaxis protein